MEFNIVGCVGEVNLQQREDTLKVEILNLIESEYELYLTFENTCKFFYCKFIARNVLLKKESHQVSESNQKIFKVLLWKTLCLPFEVKNLFLSSKSLWAVGEDCFVDIKLHVENAVKTNEFNTDLTLGEDFMDIDVDEEFSMQEFESSIKIPSMQKHKLQKETHCLRCQLIDNSILICTKNLKTRSWHTNLAVHFLKSADVKYFPLPGLPLTYDEPALSVDSSSTKVGQNNFKPVITFIYRRDFSKHGPFETKNNILHKLLSIDPVSSNCICLIGHHEGNLLYFLCSKSAQNDNFKVNSQMEQLYQMKQPIVGIHFIEEIKGIEGNGFILIIGSLGKLVFITAEQLLKNSEVNKTGAVSFHAANFNLPTSVHKYAIFQGCIFHTSDNGDLWLSKLSSQTEKNPLNKVDFSSFVIMHGIADIVLINNLKGLFLVITLTGNLYVGIYAEKTEPTRTSASLPSLMNEIMHQSTVLKNMALTASYQHKFFAALTTFANLKYNGAKKCSVSCSVTEVDEAFKKFILSVSVTCSEKFNCEFWFMIVSLYSHFQKDSALVSKTIPFIPAQSINIELEESLLCQPYASPFPIHVEVGLLLVLPEKFQTMPCFQLICKKLPMYIRIQTLILNELYFMKHKAPNSQNQSISSLENSRSTLSNIHRLSMNKPISTLFKIEQHSLSNHRQNLIFCLLASSAQGILKTNSSGSLLANEISKLLLKKSHLQCETEDSRLVFRNQAVNVLVSAHENNVSINVHADSFVLLAGIRMAVMELLLKEQGKSNIQSSQYVCIPADINKNCEKLSKDLLCMFKEESNTTDVIEKIVLLYNNLRKEVSGVLPFC